MILICFGGFSQLGWCCHDYYSIWMWSMPALLMSTLEVVASWEGDFFLLTFKCFFYSCSSINIHTFHYQFLEYNICHMVRGYTNLPFSAPSRSLNVTYYFKIVQFFFLYQVTNHWPALEGVTDARFG